jgi:hypothetical protein
MYANPRCSNVAPTFGGKNVRRIPVQFYIRGVSKYAIVFLRVAIFFNGRSPLSRYMPSCLIGTTQEITQGGK